MDSQIGAQFMLEALQGKPKEQTKGFSVVSIPVLLDRDHNGIPNTLKTSDLAATVRATWILPSSPQPPQMCRSTTWSRPPYDGASSAENRPCPTR